MLIFEKSNNEHYKSKYLVFILAIILEIVREAFVKTEINR